MTSFKPINSNTSIDFTQFDENLLKHFGVNGTTLNCRFGIAPSFENSTEDLSDSEKEELRSIENETRAQEKIRREKGDNELKQLHAQAAQLHQHLLELQQITQSMNLTAYEMINWAEILYSENLSDEDINKTKRKLSSPWVRLVEGETKNWDFRMTMAYLGLNTIGLAVAIAAGPGCNSDISSYLLADGTGVATAWNGIDIIGSAVAGIKQISLGETELGTVNLVSAGQMLVCSILADVVVYAPGSAGLQSFTPLAAVGLLGLSFALAMFFSAYGEMREMQKCIKRKDELLDSLSLGPLKNITSPKELALASRIWENEGRLSGHQKKQLLLAVNLHAQAANHWRSSLSWFGCGIGMTLIGCSTLGAYWLGAGPSIDLIASNAAAFATGLLRSFIVRRVDHVQEVKKILSKDSYYIEGVEKNNLSRWKQVVLPRDIREVQEQRKKPSVKNLFCHFLPNSIKKTSKYLYEKISTTTGYGKV